MLIAWWVTPLSCCLSGRTTQTAVADWWCPGLPGACNWKMPNSVLRKEKFAFYYINFYRLNKGQLINKLSKISRPTNLKRRPNLLFWPRKGNLQPWWCLQIDRKCFPWATALSFHAYIYIVRVKDTAVVFFYSIHPQKILSEIDACVMLKFILCLCTGQCTRNVV